VPDLLSVCIPSHRSPWLAETETSVRSQPLPRGLELELLVLEDLEGRGAGWTRNRLHEQARGDWILKLDSDDLMPDGLLIRLWNARRLAAIVCPMTAQFFDADGPKHRWSYAGIKPVEVLTRIVSPASSAGCLLYHRATHERCGGFPEDCGAYESWVFVCERVAAGVPLFAVPAAEYLHRLHAGSYWDSSAPTRREDLHRAMLRVNEVYAEAFS
jgi:glycosyltransferase involved in cell wall biosynthesis